MVDELRLVTVIIMDSELATSYSKTHRPLSDLQNNKFKVSFTRKFHTLVHTTPSISLLNLVPSS